jgi:hypothetical protein
MTSWGGAVVVPGTRWTASDLYRPACGCAAGSGEGAAEEPSAFFFFLKKPAIPLSVVSSNIKQQE